MRKEDETLLQTARNVFKALNHTLETGPWQSSLFLRSIGGKLRSLRDQFAAVLQAPEAVSSVEHEMQAQRKQEVFIALYQARGDDLHRWQNIIANLGGFCINRPIYQQEADIRASMMVGEANSNHAYVAVKVESEDILPCSKEEHQVDRAGRPLVRLKEGVIAPGNLVRFVHTSGEYKWVNHFLVKQGEGFSQATQELV